jgi:hypothetical protein
MDVLLQLAVDYWNSDTKYGQVGTTSLEIHFVRACQRLK